MSNYFKNSLQNFSDIIFPRECSNCKVLLNRGELHLCTKCFYKLPKSLTWKEKDNYVARMFWGRLYLENAASFLLFQKGNMVQEILHQIKYKKQKETGYFMGLLFGNELKETSFDHIDIIVPIPLHKEKEKLRKFNQSEWIGKGMAESLKKPLITNLVKRTLYNESQTSKMKYERWLNVEKIFELQNFEEFAGKHILIVDDVLTTGATIEACAQELFQIPNVKISVATLAMAV